MKKRSSSRYSPRRYGWCPALTSSSTSMCGFEALNAGRKDWAKSLFGEVKVRRLGSKR